MVSKIPAFAGNAVRVINGILFTTTNELKEYPLKSKGMAPLPLNPRKRTKETGGPVRGINANINVSANEAVKSARFLLSLRGSHGMMGAVLNSI